MKTKRHLFNTLVVTLLITCLLSSFIFAFMTAEDKRVNVFTVGNVSIELYEDDEYLPAAQRTGEFNWYVHGTDTVANDTNHNNIPDFAESIKPGAEITKTPYIKNTGTGSAWVYYVVSVPTSTKDNIYLNINQQTGVISEALAGEELNVDVTAYAIQEGYGGANNDTSAEIWAAYNPALAEEASDISDRIPLFTINNIDSSLTLIDTVYGNDGNNYYVYGMNELLEDGVTTDPAFTSVTLNNSIGKEEPITVGYFVPEGSGAQGTGAGETNLSVEPPEAPAGYELLNYVQLNPGDSIGELYWDDSLIKSDEYEYSFEWRNYDTNETVYSNENFYSNTILIPHYENISPYIDENNPSLGRYPHAGYLSYGLEASGAVLNGAYYLAPDYPTEPTTVVVPSFVVFDKISQNKYHCENGYVGDKYTDIANTGMKSEWLNATDGKYYVPIVRIAIGRPGAATGTGSSYNADNYGNSIVKISKEVVLPLTVTSVNYVGGYSGSTNYSVLEKINIPFKCKYLGGDSLNAIYNTSVSSGLCKNPYLTSVTLPSSLEIVGSFSSTALTEITVPPSVVASHLSLPSTINRVTIPANMRSLGPLFQSTKVNDEVFFESVDTEVVFLHSGSYNVKAQTLKINATIEEFKNSKLHNSINFISNSVWKNNFNRVEFKDAVLYKENVQTCNICTCSYHPELGCCCDKSPYLVQNNYYSNCLTKIRSTTEQYPPFPNVTYISYNALSSYNSATLTIETPFRFTNTTNISWPSKIQTINISHATYDTIVAWNSKVFTNYQGTFNYTD